MEEESREVLCERIADNIADSDARLKSDNAELRAAEAQIRQGEARVEQLERRVRDLMIPAIPGLGRQRSRLGRAIEDHADLVQEVNRVNRLSDAQSLLAAEIRRLDILRAKIPALERSIENRRRLLDESAADFARMRCSDGVALGLLRR